MFARSKRRTKARKPPGPWGNRANMNPEVNPALTAHVPIFITAPNQTDVLMVVVGIFLLGAVVGFGVLFFWLHSLPERIAHKTHKLQFEIVAVLGLLALFTHIHLFWVIGLLLALIDIPDFGGWMGRIAASTEKMAGIEPPPEAAPAEQHLPAGVPAVSAQQAKEPVHA